jgi:tetratricopeptide (TPR) repeat protein
MTTPHVQPPGVDAASSSDVCLASQDPAAPGCHRLVFLLASTLLILPIPAAMAGPAADSPRRTGAPAMLEPHTESLLVDYYETYLRDHDINAFRQQVSSRYMEGTLTRLLESANLQARRASVLALGLFGSFGANASVARSLKDRDPTIRSLADNALWAIWFRADTPENNATLERVAALVSHQRLEEAIALASRLIDRSPQFAEAYNQRAIAHFFLGHFQESAEDCRLVLARNPYHTGALAGLAKCELQLGRRAEAIETLKRAAKLQPYKHDLPELIAALEAEQP